METKKTYKSFRYKTNLVWNAGRRGGSLSASGKPTLQVGSAPEFKGEAGNWSPEDLLVGSLNTCLMLTFLAFAYNKGLEPLSYESSAEGLLENVGGKYRVTEITVEPNVALKSQADLETARAIMDKVEENCFISNSITAKVKLSPQLRVESGKM